MASPELIRLFAVSGRVGSSRVHDKHLGLASDTFPDSGRRPLDLLWAEAAEILTWAEKGILPEEEAARFRTLLWPNSGLERSAPGLTDLGVGRVSESEGHDVGLGLAWI